MFYETELLISSNILALVLGVLIGRWANRSRHRFIDVSRFAHNGRAEEASGNGRAKR